jgi:hypothetical protein
MNLGSTYQKGLSALKRLGVTTGFIGLIVTGASTYSAQRNDNVVRAEQASLDIGNYLSKTEAFGRPCLKLADKIKDPAVLAALLVGNDNSGVSFAVVQKVVPDDTGLERACLTRAAQHFFQESGLSDKTSSYDSKDDVQNYLVFRHVLIDIANLFDSEFLLWKKGVLDQYTMCDAMKGVLGTTEASSNGGRKAHPALTTTFILKVGQLAPKFQRVAGNYPGLVWAARTRGYCGSRVGNVWREYFNLFVP